MATYVVPVGLDAHGLPVGLRIVGPPLGEALAAAAEIARRRPLGVLDLDRRRR